MLFQEMVNLLNELNLKFSLRGSQNKQNEIPVQLINSVFKKSIINLFSNVTFGYLGFALRVKMYNCGMILSVSRNSQPRKRSH